MEHLANISLFEALENQAGNGVFNAGTHVRPGYQVVDTSTNQPYGFYSDMDADDIYDTLKSFSDMVVRGDMTKEQAFAYLRSYYGIQPKQIGPWMRRYLREKKTEEDVADTFGPRYESRPKNVVTPKNQPYRVPRQPASKQSFLRKFAGRINPFK